MDALLLTRDPSLGALFEAALASRSDSLFIAGDTVTAGDQAEANKAALVVIDDPDRLVDLAYLMRRARQNAAHRAILFLVRKADQSALDLARHHRVRDLLVKPLTSDALQERLQRLMGNGKPNSEEHREPASPEGWLQRAIDQGTLSLPLSSRTFQLLQQLGQGSARASALEKVWRDEPAIIARLLGAANTSSYNPSMVLCETLHDAIQVLGPERSLNLARGIGLHCGSSLLDPRLVERGGEVVRQSCEVAHVVYRLAGQLGVNAEACYSAAILSQLGELAVLEELQCWLNHGRSLEDDQIDELLLRFKVPASHELKRQWRIPVVVRDRAGSVHALPAATTVSRDRLAMRVAGELIQSGHTKNVRPLMDLLGLERAQTEAMRSEQHADQS